MAKPKNVREKEGQPPEVLKLRSELFEATGHLNWHNPISFPVAMTILGEHLKRQGCSEPALLDVGCGNGEFTRLFLDAFPKGRAVCVDASDRHVEVARKRLSGFQGQVRFLNEAFEGLSDHGDLGHFDCAMAANVFHFIDEDDLNTCVKVVHDLLSDGGIFLAIQFMSRPTELEELYRQGNARFQEDVPGDSAQDAEAGELRARLEELRKTGVPSGFHFKNVRHSFVGMENAFREAGFVAFDCAWKLFDWAMFVGLKGSI